MSAETRQAVPILRDDIDATARLLRLFDAFANASVAPPTLQLHDYDGTIIAALTLWASSHALVVESQVLDLPQYSWTRYLVSGISVHDTRSRVYHAPVTTEQAAGAWSPAQHAAVKS